MNHEMSFVKLLKLREEWVRREARGAAAAPPTPPLRGGGLEAPADVLPLLQVAAFLWCPDTMMVEPDDSVGKRAVQSVFANAGLPVRERHMLEVENPRLRIMAAHRKNEKSSQLSDHPTTPPDATSVPG